MVTFVYSIIGSGRNVTRVSTTRAGPWFDNELAELTVRRDAIMRCEPDVLFRIFVAYAEGGWRVILQYEAVCFICVLHDDCKPSVHMVNTLATQCSGTMEMLSAIHTLFAHAIEAKTPTPDATAWDAVYGRMLDGLHEHGFSVS